MKAAAFHTMLLTGLSAGSALASPSPFAVLSEASQAYYELVYVYAMEAMQPGQGYAWESYEASGSIIPERPFTSKSGSTCRGFSEEYTIGGKKGHDKGVACKRVGKEGWCRLKASDAMTCALETPDNPIEESLRDTSEMLGRQKANAHSWDHWLRGLR